MSAFAEKSTTFLFVDADYDPDNWFARAKGQMEWEPEARAQRCHHVPSTWRFERTQRSTPMKNGFPVMTSSLGISRAGITLPQINDCGHSSGHPAYDGLTYLGIQLAQGWWARQRMIEISKREEFYQQEYLRFVAYSLREHEPSSPVEWPHGRS